MGELLDAPVRVLAIDDNRDVADSTVLMLNIVGFEARACYDGKSAVTLAASFRPNICLIDLNMPGISGDEVALRIRATADWKPLLLVAITAMSNDASRQRTKNAGFHMHLVKPVDPRDLLKVVDALFRLGDCSAVVAECGDLPAMEQPK